MTLDALHKGPSIANLACSVQRRFGLPARHEGLKEGDGLLAIGHRNVVVLLYDGLGCSVLREHLPEERFLRRHMISTFHSTFPPTTTAATTSMLAGLTPAEHGWLGWSLYLPDYGHVVDLYPNTIKGSGIPVASHSAAHAVMPFRPLPGQIVDAGGEAHLLSSVRGFGEFHPTLEGMLARAKQLCAQPGERYLYCYWTEPDAVLHDYGCGSAEARKAILGINEKTQTFCQGLQDALVVVTADHGHRNVRYRFLSDHPQLAKLLSRPISVEAPACFT